MHRRFELACDTQHDAPGSPKAWPHHTAAELALRPYYTAAELALWPATSADAVPGLQWLLARGQAGLTASMPLLLYLPRLPSVYKSVAHH